LVNFSLRATESSDFVPGIRNDIERNRSDLPRRRRACGSENDADAYAPPPDDAAFLFDAAMDELEAIRQRHHRKYFEAGSARRVVDQPARDHGRLWGNDNLGLVSDKTSRLDSLV
jgi:hypothetical protein